MPHKILRLLERDKNMKYGRNRHKRSKARKKEWLEEG